MSWQRFDETSRSFVAKATISPHGTLSFTEGACTRYAIKSADGVILYFDPDGFKVGIELAYTRAGEEEPPGFIRLRKHDSGASLSAKRFLDRFDVLPSQTTSFRLTQEKGTEYLVLDLLQGIERKAGEQGATEEEEQEE